jgi:RNA polymerase sigma-70 factor (ECF subfamily)
MDGTLLRSPGTASGGEFALLLHKGVRSARKGSAALGRMEKPLRLEASSPDTDVSALLRAWSDGDQDALQALTPIVYEELHRLARHYMRRERSGHSLQATALVNEAYMRLADYTRMQWQDRAHFFAVSAQAMRRILVDHARRHNVKRGGDVQHVSLEDVAVVAQGEDAETDLVALDEALIGLTRIDPRKAQIVELRFFGGLTVEEIGGVLKVSPGTVKRDWRAAKAWLYQELTR